MEEFKRLKELDEAEGKLEEDVSLRQLQYLKDFWAAVRETWKEAFDNPREYLLLRAVGAYVMSWLAADIFRWCVRKGVELPSKDDIKAYLDRIFLSHSS